MISTNINEMNQENAWTMLLEMTKEFMCNAFTSGLDYNELHKTMKNAVICADSAEEKEERISRWNEYIVMSARECFDRQEYSYEVLTENRTIFHLMSEKEQIQVTKAAQEALIGYSARYRDEEERGKKRSFFGRLFARTA